MSNNEAQKGLKAAPERIVLWCGDEPDALTGAKYVRADIADAAQAEVERLKAENDNLAVKLAWAESREQNALSRLALRGVTGGEPDA
jgi:methionine-rich copper-binding protein CopC